MITPCKCDACGVELSDYKNMVCFYPWDEEEKCVSNANPLVFMCNHCFDELRNTFAMMKAINDLDALSKACIYKEVLDFERGENEH